jgi:arylsulfatase A-like enzyme
MSKPSFTFRTFLKFVFLFLFLFIVIFIANSIINAFKINYFSFHKSANRILRKSEQISIKAKNFNESEVLRKLGTNNFNGFYYRFDENLMSARHPKNINRRTNINQKKSNNIFFEFNNRDDLQIKPSQNNFIIDNGILKYKHNKSNFLESFKKLDIDKDSIGEIKLRLKIKNAEKLILGWSRDFAAAALNPHQTDYLTIWTIPDNTFHTYTVDAKLVLKGFLKTGESIKKLFLFPFETSYDEVEIDYLRLISKKEKYSQKHCGVVYETINKEIRKAVYMQTPYELKYIVNMPEDKVFLKFGMGALNKNDPLQFDIKIKSDHKQKVLFSKKISTPDMWHDATIDISDYSNKRIEISFLAKGSKSNIAFWSNPILFSPPDQRLNVIIVLEDALRSDHLSCNGNFRKTTPVKDEFAKKGIIFSNAFSQSTHTRSSCPSFMTSLYPSATGVWNASEVLNDRYLTLAEIMRNQGFATALFTQNVNAGPNVGLHQGFSTIFDPELSGSRSHHIYDGAILKKWIKENNDRNFFLYLHLLDPHGPYDPPEEFAAKYRKHSIGGKKIVKRDKLLDPEWLQVPTVESRNFLYDEEIRYNDLNFEKFLNLLNKEKLFDDTLIIFIADHGEHLGEHAIWNHVPPGYIHVLHVPMIMVYPKRFPQNTRIQQPVQLVDVMPTILDIANIQKNNLLIEGDSLLSLISGEKIDFWNNRFCISEEVKFKRKDDTSVYGSIFYRNWHILNSDKLNDTISYKVKNLSPSLYETLLLETRVFDLSKDKDEYFDSLNFLSDIIFNMKTQSFLKKYRTSNLATWRTLTKNTDQTIKYDPAALEQLRSLGYIK